MFRLLRRLARSGSGATAIEYGLIAALVSIAAIGAFQAVGGSLQGIFSNVAGIIPTSSQAGGST